jgi:hypothetical protein
MQDCISNPSNAKMTMPLFSQRKRIGGSLSRPSQRSNTNWIVLSLITLLVIAVLTVFVYVYLLQSTVKTFRKQPPEHFKQQLQQELQLRDAAHDKKRQRQEAPSRHTLVLMTSIGAIRIVLRTDLSKESADYAHAMVSSSNDNKKSGQKQEQPPHNCPHCNLYRAEKPGILQGVFDHPKVPLVTTKGSCPTGLDTVPNECPAWDTACSCHGPIMTRGMVGWAAGQTGPDFFINAYEAPATFWGTQHTVWGEIQDDASFQLIDHIWTLPARDENGLTMLDEPLHFEVTMESS